MQAGVQSAAFCREKTSFLISGEIIPGGTADLDNYSSSINLRIHMHLNSQSLYSHFGESEVFCPQVSPAGRAIHGTNDPH